MNEKDIESSLNTCLQEIFGYHSFRTNQKEIILNTLKGKNSLVVMPTGIGKSLCFQLPALVSEGTAVIVSPLIALMKNQVDVLRFKHSDDNIALVYNSTLTVKQTNNFKDCVRNGKTKLVYVSPESLMKDELIELLSGVKISFLAVDEAHCISEWGINFRPEYRKIKHFSEAMSNSFPIMALTATATDKVRQDIIDSLEIEDPTLFTVSFNRPNLFYDIKEKTQGFEKEILLFIKTHKEQSGIVYCLSRKKVEEFAEFLKINGVQAAPYHAGMNSKERDRVQEGFLNGNIHIIVATIAFGMGIDKPDIRFVIHHDFSKSLENYYQETGRAGRDGLRAECLAYYHEKDFRKLYGLLKDKKTEDRKALMAMLDEVVEFTTSGICRRQEVLYYFGEEFDSKDCHDMCDNCLAANQTQSIKDEMLKIVEAIQKRPHYYKSDSLIHLLLDHNHTIQRENSDFDSVVEKKSSLIIEKEYAFLRSIIRFAVVNGFITKSLEHGFCFVVTEKGNEFANNPYTLEIPMSKKNVQSSAHSKKEKPSKEDEEVDFDDNEDLDVNADDDDDAEPKGGKEDFSQGKHFDPDLYSILERKRKAMATEHKVPPFVIFQDSSLEEMCVFYPTSIESLKQIVGVGSSKAIRYGKPIVETIAKYVDENNIEVLDDVVVRGLGSKSKLKISIISAIDRKVDLIDFAESMALPFDELLSEIESIVYGGTKININYFINSEIEPEKVDDIYAYFKQATSDSIDEAISELGEDDFATEEVRLVRIKFMSELAN